MNRIRFRAPRNLRVRSLGVGLLVVAMGVGVNAGSLAGAAVKPKALASITLAGSTSNVNILPVWNGIAQGDFAQHGINLNPVILTASTYVTALLSGSVQFLSLNATTLIADRQSQHLPIEAIAPSSVGESISLIITSQFATQKGITKTTPLKTIIQDLIGSTGGSSSPVTTGQAYVLLKAYGVQPSQVTEASFSSLPAVQTAFEKNAISWFVASAPTPQQIQALGFGTIVASAKNAPAWRVAAYNIVLTTTTAYAAADPGITREMVASFLESTTYIHQHAAKTVTTLEMNQPGISRPILYQAIEALQWPTSSKMNAHQWSVTNAFAVKSGQVAPGYKIAEDVDWTNKY